MPQSAFWTPEVGSPSRAKHAPSASPAKRSAVRGVLSAAVVTGALVSIPGSALAAPHHAAPAPAPAAVQTAVAPASTGARAAALALAQLGKPYVWGATGPNSFDCSGLAQWAYKQVGVNLPRTTYTQERVGVPVSPAALQPGDLVFFYGGGHVGIYVGNGNVVHAPQPGQGVKVTAMKYMPFTTARRVG